MISAEVHSDEFCAWLDAVQDRLDSAVAAQWTVEASEARDSQREYHYQNRTGRLSASMRVSTVRVGPLSYRSVIITDTPYALWVDAATKAHPIPLEAKFGVLLRFYWAKRGCWVCAKQVQHPGTHGAGFSEHARQHFNVRAPGRLQDAVDAAVSSAG